MAKQPKMDGAQNQQGQDTVLGEEGGSRQGWGRSLGEEEERASCCFPPRPTVNPFPTAARGLARALFRIQAKEEPELYSTQLESLLFSPTAPCNSVGIP